MCKVIVNHFEVEYLGHFLMKFFFVNSVEILKDGKAHKRSEKKIRLVSCMQWLTEKRVQKKVAQIAISATLPIFFFIFAFLKVALASGATLKKNLVEIIYFFNFFFVFWQL